MTRATLLETTGNVKDEAVQRSLPGFYLRSFDDVVKSLGAPDPLERWQAAHASFDCAGTWEDRWTTRGQGERPRGDYRYLRE